MSDTATGYCGLGSSVRELALSSGEPSQFDVGFNVEVDVAVSLKLRLVQEGGPCARYNSNAFRLIVCIPRSCQLRLCNGHVQRMQG